MNARTQVIVSMVHILFDVLAFKNDVQHWKGSKTVGGVSSRSVVLTGLFCVWSGFYLTIILALSQKLTLACPVAPIRSFTLMCS